MHLCISASRFSFPVSIAPAFTTTLELACAFAGSSIPSILTVNGSAVTSPSKSCKVDLPLKWTLQAPFQS